MKNKRFSFVVSSILLNWSTCMAERGELGAWNELNGSGGGNVLTSVLILVIILIIIFTFSRR